MSLFVTQQALVSECNTPDYGVLVGKAPTQPKLAMLPRVPAIAQKFSLDANNNFSRNKVFNSFIPKLGFTKSDKSFILITLLLNLT